MRARPAVRSGTYAVWAFAFDSTSRVINMGVSHNDGYSATVEAFLLIGEQRLKVAKVGRDLLTFSHSCELPPGAEGTLTIKIDGDESTRLIALDDGAFAGSDSVRYSTAAPF